MNGFDQTYRNSARDDSDLRNRLLLARVRPISLWHRARVVHLFHPPHPERLLWADADRYYQRADLRAGVACGSARARARAARAREPRARAAHGNLIRSAPA